jgi:hypothetical protein
VRETDEAWKLRNYESWDYPRAARGAASAPPSSARHFHGWRIVAYSALAMAMIAPGQTTGVSVFIDPIIADLDINRTQVSTAYLTGTLIGACAMPRSAARSTATAPAA